MYSYITSTWYVVSFVNVGIMLVKYKNTKLLATCVIIFSWKKNYVSFHLLSCPLKTAETMNHFLIPMT